MSEAELRATYRILDASSNRASEGLRTLEEFARFLLDDAEATADLKAARHELAAALTRFPRTLLLSSRDTDSDVGTEISQPSEWVRQNVGEVVAAAASRTAQSLRVLEEYGKTIDAEVAARIEQLRYRCYTIFANLELKLSRNVRRQRLAESHLYALVDAGEDANQFADLVRLLFTSGVDIIQLRDHNHDDRTLIERAKLAMAIRHEVGGLFIVNDRADLALAADADGVHVGQEELPVDVARQILGPERLIGLSTHDIHQARQAQLAGADYIGCGPVFPGQTKSFDDYVGPDFLRQVASDIELPSFAIGGIDGSNVDQVIDAGFHRIAVTGVLRDTDDPASTARALKNQLTAANDHTVPSGDR